MIPGWQEVAPTSKRFMMAVSAVVLLLYAVTTFWSASAMSANKTKAEANHRARMTSTAVEPGKTAPDPLPDGNFTEVTVGTYFEDIENLSIKDSSWNANFYLWFSWKGDATLDPGGKFILVDGAVLKKETMEEYHGQDGVNYQRYRVSAKLIKFFDTFRVPIESHMLNVYLEDGSRDGSKIRFVADKASNYSSRLKIPGFKILGTESTVKNHTYKSTYGDPRVAEGSRKTFSQFVVALNINRIDYGFYFKVFLSLFAAIALTLSSFFIKASDVAPRFALPTGAYFGAVANSYVANSILPPSGTFGLVDHIAGVGLFTIFLCIALSLISNLYTKKDMAKESVVFDRLMFLLVGLGCLVANIVIPLSARG